MPDHSPLMRPKIRPVNRPVLAPVNKGRTAASLALGCAAAISLVACSTLGASGPSADAVRDSAQGDIAREMIQIVELDRQVAAALKAHDDAASFAEMFSDPQSRATLIGAGDLLQIDIWEAPPAVLFGAGAPSISGSGDVETAGAAAIPPQAVGEDGRVTVPFIGRIAVAGRRPEEVEADITSRLAGRANAPQALVRLTQNESRTVTVLGAVARSGRMTLSARGERLLDALADAGGTSAPIEQSTIQLARGNSRASMPVESVIVDPRQNISLLADDVVTVQHQPFSFVAIGAMRNNAEIPFEGGGITLAEALGRAGGLNDRQADIKGVFVFRMESREAIERMLPGQTPDTTADGRVPVIYSLRMTDAQSLFAMQDFAMRDRDVLYIATAPGVELERFIATLSTTAFSIVATVNAVEGP
ncbi:MAG: polysaccharide export protein [Rhodobacteraceae bacterium]|nr:polysaccharide export protein [Paracoccaceae bacterium]